MSWEFYILNRGRWAPYDPYNDDKIEEAYQKYQVDDSRQNREIEITVNKKYTYTINFEHMNSTSHGPNKDRTDIRRVAYDAGDAGGRAAPAGVRAAPPARTAGVMVRGEGPGAPAAPAGPPGRWQMSDTNLWPRTWKDLPGDESTAVEAAWQGGGPSGKHSTARWAANKKFKIRGLKLQIQIPNSSNFRTF